MGDEIRDPADPSGLRPRLIVAGFVGFMAGVLLMFLADHIQRPGLRPWALVVSFLGAGLIVFQAAFRARAESLLERHKFKLCPWCNFDLQQVPSPGRCPECGQQFDAKDLEDIWRRWLESRRS